MSFDPRQSRDPDGTLLAIEMDFEGDGHYDWRSAELEIVEHQYAFPGTYRPTLRVTDDSALTREAASEIVVHPRPNRPPTLAPMAQINVREGELVTIDPMVADPDGDEVQVVFSGWMTFNTYLTTFQDAGVHTVTVTATDPHGESTSGEVVVVVENVNRAPLAALNADPPVGEAPLVVRFELTGSADPDGTPIAMQLDFEGDGNFDWTGTSSVEAVTHLYSNPGTFKPVLRVTDDGGLWRAASVDLLVKPRPNIPPIIEPMADVTIKEGETVSLAPVAYDPDGDEVTLAYSGWMAAESYTTGFEDAGHHVVTVTAVDIHGASTSRDILIQVLDAVPHLPIDPAGLIGYWPLDGHWQDVQGGNDLEPMSPGGFALSLYVRGFDNQSYGPTTQSSGNGASNALPSGLTSAQGLTLEGWVFLPDNNTTGEFFGFGTASDYNNPKLNISAAFGFIKVWLGQKGKGNVWTSAARLSDRCWHHLALVLPANFSAGASLKFYLDAQLPAGAFTSGSYQTNGNGITDAMLFNAPFKIGTFSGTSAGAVKVDEVRLWARALSETEITLLATTTGQGAKCESSGGGGGGGSGWIPPWPRFVAPQTPPQPQIDLGVRVLADNVIAIVSDPNPWLKARVVSDCGAFLSALEQNRQAVPAWSYQFHYNFAAKETILAYRPGILAALDDTTQSHFTIQGPEADASKVPLASVVWPQATREFQVPLLAPEGGVFYANSSENVYFSYAALPFPLESGKTYSVEDRWGNATTFTYDENSTISWALKVNQVGYLADAPQKYAYLGAWMGPAAGALDCSRFDGAPFEICRESDQAVVYQGRIQFRAAEASENPKKLTGEKVYQLDFSDFKIPGKYYIRVAGLGRSWAFAVGQNALGEAFYTHTRGLFHQRCGMELPRANTPWARGDLHATWRGGFPPDIATDYKDHTAEGWGFRDQNGAFPKYNRVPFDVVAYTATEEALPHVRGGWHDAADFDRRPYHFEVVNDLVHAYLFFPENFTDAQLHLPESANGIPDILDEAIWGMEVWRQAQEPDGRVATWIEATSHPLVFDPGQDDQRYYLSLATRNSSLHYAAHAALLGRALLRAGAAAPGQAFIESARRAYAFGVNPTVRVSTSFKVGDATHTWTEPPIPDPSRRVQALIQLWLATGDTAYFNELRMEEMHGTFEKEVTDLHWRTCAFDLLDVALAPELFPQRPTRWGATWSDSAKTRILMLANDWLTWQSQDAYRKPWYPLEHGYFSHLGYGATGFRHISRLIAGWRLAGEAQYRAGALLAVDWLHGANPQGRVNTTGLGQNRTVSPLHLPSAADGLAEPVPGISIYGYSGSFPGAARTDVYGLFSTPRPDHCFLGSALAQLPMPWDSPALTTDEIGAILYEQVPLWRRLTTLEWMNVNQSEFTVHETIGPAAAVTGCLMGSGWKPSAELLNRQPASEAELKDSLWFQP